MSIFVILVAMVTNGEFQIGYVNAELTQSDKLNSLSFGSMDECEARLIEYFTTDKRPIVISSSYEADLEKKRKKTILSYTKGETKVSYTCASLSLPEK